MVKPIIYLTLFTALSLAANPARRHEGPDHDHDVTSVVGSSPPAQTIGSHHDEQDDHGHSATVPGVPIHTSILGHDNGQHNSRVTTTLTGGSAPVAPTSAPVASTSTPAASGSGPATSASGAAAATTSAGGDSGGSTTGLSWSLAAAMAVFVGYMV